MTKHFLHHKKCRNKSRFASSRALKSQLPLNPRDINTWVLNFVAMNLTFRKNRIDCTQGSSNFPERRTNSAFNIENMSNFPITLKLGLCAIFSNWTELKVKGYCTPAFRVRSLSRALMKSLSPPPLHTNGRTR